MDESSGRSALVVGAGIGGLTVAAALDRAGWRVTVLERAPQLGEVGAGISIWPRAWAILTELGVAEHLVDGVRPAIQAGLRRPDGRWLAKAGAATTARGPVMVHRARLHEALVGSLGEVEIRTGVTVDQVCDGGRGAVVETTAGDSLEADLVVAADGIRSSIRSGVRSRDDVRYAGYTAYRGVTAKPVPGEASTSGGETWGAGVRFGYAPLVDGRTYWFVSANRPAGERSDDHHRDVTALVGDWHEPIAQLIAATPADAVLRNDICDLRLPLGRFDHGRVALLGDAAHAMTPNLGQGACAAVEDAAALVARLVDEPEIGRALTAYDRERRPATQRLVRASRLVGTVGQIDNGAVLAARDAGITGVGAIAGLLGR
ncbi:2-polyprenyl-6-methoxyphenol hydroxylase-like FAD-dependent oxidoreductase [Nocardioides albertanoniae]|uniref:2-polyprenyl-6-methoxyphenol hydroxylase-like FAD-dependent oxidoreductase n=1 Tax=Nocardioides albertanoniae TaxID=1175486 RepID=A0A543A987_9ACTN|nr:FAD-dependent monooxygenase [Nocardioides albertanoniae]TQL69060.1 2-polyprenyl-6-methoxyphenol hydroxylase-like FAD-dependent oxidoreductase [Nocardioides albertanoniae]